jgi:hypothetical protein
VDALDVRVVSAQRRGRISYQRAGYIREPLIPETRSMRILHILDHSIPLHSGYTFRTLAILQQQRALGWETFHLTWTQTGGRSQPRKNKWTAGIFIVRPLRADYLTAYQGLRKLS